MVEMELTAVRVDLQSNTPVVLLQETGGARRTLPIFIGAPEATAIAYAMQNVVVQRPLTHDLLRDVLLELGASVDAVVITGWDPTISQQGQAVFRWATTQIAPLARETCRRAGLEPSELRGFVAHQANLRIIDAIAAKLGAGPDAVIARDVVDSGNTSAASIPLALSKLVERGELRSGDPVLLFGFGGGLAYAGQVVR